MFEITEDPRGFRRLKVSGRIGEDEMRAGLDAFLASLPEAGKADFLYTITDFEFPGLQALAVEFGYLPRLMGALPRIGRIAVVSDAEWIRKWADFEGAMIPMLEIRAFPPEAAADAERWLTTSPREDMPI